MADQPPIPRVVKKRRTGYTHRPLFVIDLEEGAGYSETLGRPLSLPDAISALRVMPSSLVVTPDAARLLGHLEDTYGTDPRWQYRVTPLKRQVMRVNGELSSWKSVSTLVNFFGWQRTNGHADSLYHYTLDPYVFCRLGINELLPPGIEGVEDRTYRLLQWGRDVRSWCEGQDLKISPTSGGIAAQLLKDPRWFPAERRKVPKATNARIRPRLPGNYYKLLADVNTPYQANYLDMAASHHTIAATTTFPHPDHLTARGYFRVSDGPVVTVSDNRPWLKPGGRGYKRLTQDAHGLLYLRMTNPPMAPERFAPPYMTHGGSKMAWVYTNELPMIRALGGVIEHITAAWVSFVPDPSLNRYARFALDQLATATEDRKRWLKPALLSTYGILAAKPQETEYGYRRAKGGVPRQYPAGSRMIPAQAMTAPERESPLVNVMYRGLIEAEQRRRALDLARELHGLGHRVLAIYADSVFTESGPPLPFLPAGWRLDAELDALYFSSAVHFTSRTLTKLPGVKRDSTERVQLMANIRRQ